MLSVSHPFAKRCDGLGLFSRLCGATSGLAPRTGENAGQTAAHAAVRTTVLGGALAALVLGLAAPALASVPAPRLKPEQPAVSQVVAESDLRRLRIAFEAADDGRWMDVANAQTQVSDDDARKLILWRRAVSDPDMSFFELDAALVQLSEWPRTNVIQSEAEAKIDTSGFTPEQTIAWFEARTPRSGRGKIAQAEALLAAGQRSEGLEALRATWRSDLLPLTVQRDVARRHAGVLSRADHEARVDALLWQGHRNSARALLSYLSADQRRLAEARIALIGRERGVDRAITRVPNALSNAPSLAFERAKWRRRAGRGDDALPLILDVPADIPTDEARTRVWSERKIHIARALADDDVATAYRLAANSGLTRGVQFAEAEFLAGWLALRRLDQPEMAAPHFDRLAAGVTTPVSKSRAAYWRGRAAEALGDGHGARDSFQEASAHATTYYGQLAALRIGTTRTDIPPQAAPSDAARTQFQSRDLVRAMQLLAELHEVHLFRVFAYHLDDSLDDPAEIALLAERARSYGQDGVATRSGKSALARGIVAPDAAYPTIALPELASDAPEAAFLLALMRQESEFYTRAISPVGARGLMQIMPATARSTARQIGAPYRKNWLTDDTDYNIQLGSAYLAGLLDDFDGSYVLAAAAYNAGPSRARRWISAYGDPRSPDVDAIDWVESIPFSETRNYVQRLMENVQVYRARLNDGSAPLTLESDIRRGG